MNEKNIRELALEAAQGSAPAFQELYRRTRQGAWFVALSITKNEHDAQDILQESYLTAFKSMGRLAQPESFAPWLNQIVANKAKNYIGRKKPDFFAEYGDENAQDWQEETDAAFIPDEHLDRAEAKALIASLVSELPEDQRLVVLLRYYDDMEVAAIAKSLEVPEGTVKSRLLRARRKLAAMLEQAQGKGLKLYAMAPIPLLAYFIKLLGFDAPGSDRLPPLLIGSAAAGTAAAGGAAAAAGASAAAGAARKAALAGKLGALSGKAVAIVAAGAVTVGGLTAAGVYAYHKANPPAVITAVSTTETSDGAHTQAYEAPDQFPVPAISGPDGTQGSQARPASTQTTPSRAENGSVAGAAQGNTQTTKAPSTTRTTARASRSAASTTRAPLNLTPFPTFPSFPQITTRPRTTVSTTSPTTEPPTATEPTTTTEPPTTTEPVTTTEPAVTTEPPTTMPEFEYQRDVNGGYVISKYNGNQTHVVVPSTIDGVAVIHLGASIFEGTDVVRVELSPGIDCIRAKTFANCPNLVEVVVPPSVVTMSYNNSFSGSPNVVVVCEEGSRAHNYAKTYGIAFRLM